MRGPFSTSTKDDPAPEAAAVARTPFATEPVAGDRPGDGVRSGDDVDRAEPGGEWETRRADDGLGELPRSRWMPGKEKRSEGGVASQ